MSSRRDMKCKPVLSFTVLFTCGPMSSHGEVVFYNSNVVTYIFYGHLRLQVASVSTFFFFFSISSQSNTQNKTQIKSPTGFLFDALEMWTTPSSRLAVLLRGAKGWAEHPLRYTHVQPVPGSWEVPQWWGAFHWPQQDCSQVYQLVCVESFLNDSLGNDK